MSKDMGRRGEGKGRRGEETEVLAQVESKWSKREIFRGPTARAVS